MSASFSCPIRYNAMPRPTCKSGSSESTASARRKHSAAPAWSSQFCAAMPIQRNASALSGAKANTPTMVRIAASAFPDCDSFCARFSKRLATGDNDSGFAPIFTTLLDSYRGITGLLPELCQALPPRSKKTAGHESRRMESHAWRHLPVVGNGETHVARVRPAFHPAISGQWVIGAILERRLVVEHIEDIQLEGQVVIGPGW